MCVGVKYTRGSRYWVCDNGLCYLSDDEAKKELNI